MNGYVSRTQPRPSEPVGLSHHNEIDLGRSHNFIITSFSFPLVLSVPHPLALFVGHGSDVAIKMEILKKRLKETIRNIRIIIIATVIPIYHP